MCLRESSRRLPCLVRTTTHEHALWPDFFRGCCADLSISSIFPTTLPLAGGSLQLTAAALAQSFVAASCLIGGAAVPALVSGPQSITCSVRGTDSVCMCHALRFPVAQGCPVAMVQRTEQQLTQQVSRSDALHVLGRRPQPSHWFRP